LLSRAKHCAGQGKFALVCRGRARSARIRLLRHSDISRFPVEPFDYIQFPPFLQWAVWQKPERRPGPAFDILCFPATVFSFENVFSLCPFEFFSQ
jgi:hypothetical protein